MSPVACGSQLLLAVPCSCALLFVVARCFELLLLAAGYPCLLQLATAGGLLSQRGEPLQLVPTARPLGGAGGCIYIYIYIYIYIEDAARYRRIPLPSGRSRASGMMVSSTRDRSLQGLENRSLQGPGNRSQ